MLNGFRRCDWNLVPPSPVRIEQTRSLGRCHMRYSGSPSLFLNRHADTRTHRHATAPWQLSDQGCVSHSEPTHRNSQSFLVAPSACSVLSQTLPRPRLLRHRNNPSRLGKVLFLAPKKLEIAKRSAECAREPQSISPPIATLGYAMCAFSRQNGAASWNQEFEQADRSASQGRRALCLSAVYHSPRVRNRADVTTKRHTKSAGTKLFPSAPIEQYFIFPRDVNATYN